MGQPALLTDQIPGEGDTYAELVKLVSELAHEIRNPLSSIRLNMELLGEDISSLGDESAANQTARRAKAKRRAGRGVNLYYCPPYHCLIFPIWAASKR